MSLYQVQKLMRDVNRVPEKRAAWLADPATFVAGYDLAENERRALLARDYGTLYRMGVHGLILRPFSIVNGEPEPAYLAALQ